MNKRNLILLFSFLLCFQIGKAQSEKPHFISFNVGTAIPLSEYHAIDSLNNETALLGLSYNFESAIYLSLAFGIGFSLGGSSNGINQDNIENQVKEDLATNGSVEIKSGDWVNAYAMVGPYLSFGNKKKIMVDFKILAGVINSDKPLLSITTNDLGNIEVKKSEPTDALALGVKYGLHLRIKLIGILGLRINAEGLMAKQNFEYKVKEFKQNQEITNTEKLSTEINSLHLGAGLVLTF